MTTFSSSRVPSSSTPSFRSNPILSSYVVKREPASDGEEDDEEGEGEDPLNITDENFRLLDRDVEVITKGVGISNGGGSSKRSGGTSTRRPQRSNSPASLRSQPGTSRSHAHAQNQQQSSSRKSGLSVSSALPTPASNPTSHDNNHHLSGVDLTEIIKIGLQQQNFTLKAQNTTLETSLSQSQTQLSSVQSENTHLKSQLNTIRTSQDQIQLQQRNEIASLKTQLKEVHTRLETERDGRELAQQDLLLDREKYQTELLQLRASHHQLSEKVKTTRGISKGLEERLQKMEKLNEELEREVKEVTEGERNWKDIAEGVLKKTDKQNEDLEREVKRWRGIAEGLIKNVKGAWEDSTRLMKEAESASGSGLEPDAGSGFGKEKNEEDDSMEVDRDHKRSGKHQQGEAGASLRRSQPQHDQHAQQRPHQISQSSSLKRPRQTNSINKEIEDHPLVNSSTSASGSGFASVSGIAPGHAPSTSNIITIPTINSLSTPTGKTSTSWTEAVPGSSGRKKRKVDIFEEDNGGEQEDKKDIVDLEEEKDGSVKSEPVTDELNCFRSSSASHSSSDDSAIDELSNNNKSSNDTRSNGRLKRIPVPRRGLQSPSPSPPSGRNRRPPDEWWIAKG